MVKLGIFGDVHSNYFAYRALMATEWANCDEYVCLGDLLCMGGNPNNCFDAILRLPKLTYVQGNHDRAAMRLRRGLEVIEPRPDVERHQAYYGYITGPRYIDYIESAPLIVYREIEGVRCAFLHYAMQDEVWASPDNPPAILSSIDADLVVYGHTHQALDKVVDGKRYINFGSLGCPHSHDGVGSAGIITIDNGTITVDKLTVKYNIEQAIESLKKLDPPRLKETLAIFYGCK